MPGEIFTTVPTVIQKAAAGIGTKIVATIGPASRSKTTIAELITAGVDGFRINCSHTKPAEIAGIVADIRSCGEVFVIADLAGLKLRNRAAMRGKAGDTIEIEWGNLTHRVETVAPGARTSFGDGTFGGEVVSSGESGFTVLLDDTIEMPEMSALHVAGVGIEGCCMEDPDRAAMEAAVAAGCEWIALSYVRDGADAAKAVEAIAGRAGVIAKIERTSALEDLEAICGQVDAVMIARGDLGVDLPYTLVPSAQRSIYSTCQKLGVPVLCATEMMQSMITATRPTRAEVGDVEAVIRYGYDAIVFTAETAIGSHPVLVARTASAIRSVCEPCKTEEVALSVGVDGALAIAAAAFADDIKAEAIVAITATGHIARLVSRARPGTKILAVTADPAVARKISLYHGISARVVRGGGGVEESGPALLRKLIEDGSVCDGGACVLIGSRVGVGHDADIVMVLRAGL